MILLNRLLNRHLYEVIMPQETGLNDPVLLISDKRFFRYVSTPKNFDKYTDFAVQEGFEQSPELRRIDAALAAQKRILAASKRSFWLPEFFLQGDVTQKFAESGKGTAPIAIDTSDGTISAPKADDTDWSIGISAKFPLYQGGAKKADYLQVRQEISRLRITKRSIHHRVEERIRFFLQETSASYQAIELSRDGAHASAKNLAMVTDSYERGRVSIIDLIDAQNAALVAEQLAANAVYDFLIDLMNVQRAIGRFDFGLTPEEREQWFKRIDAFFKDNYGG
jgi:outer membrane protein TolC